MALSRVVRAFGLVVAIDTDAPDLFDLLEGQLPCFPDEPDASAPQLSYRVKVRAGGGVTVVRGRRTLATAPDVPAASTILVGDLQSAMARHAADWTFVHSGVVAIDGRALLLPGRSHAGKSTLVAALLRAGAGYGSDEFAVIDPAGRVHPYSRPLALRTPVRRLRPGELGGAVVTDSLPVATVLFTEFVADAELSLTPISPAEVALRLLQHCLGARGRPEDTMGALQAVASGAKGFIGCRGDADLAAGALMALARSGWQTPVAPRVETHPRRSTDR